MNWQELKTTFSVVAWAYHHQSGRVPFSYSKRAGHDDISPGPGREAFYDTAKELGIDILIDLHNAADLVHQRGMKLIIQTSVSPDSVDDPTGEVHWGKPCIGSPDYDWEAFYEYRSAIAVPGADVDNIKKPQYVGPGPYGNVQQLAWYEQHFGDHPAVIGYCLNDSCKPCIENIVAARWLKQNCPDRLRYVSYGEPDRQNADLFPVASFMNYAFSKDPDASKPGRRHKMFNRVNEEARRMMVRQKCWLHWPIISPTYRNRIIKAAELDYQIKTVQDSGADGVVLFPYGTWYSEFAPGKDNQIRQALKRSMVEAKATRTGAR